MRLRLLLLRLLRRWHARIGFTAMIFFLLLTATGFALNHGHALGLDARFVHSLWLARWYGLQSDAPRAFRSAHHALVAANGRWLLDGRLCGERLPQPVGIAEAAGGIVVASERALFFYRSDGRLVERLDAEALPGVPVRSVGSAGGRLVIRTGTGDFASADAIAWQPANGAAMRWSTPVPLSAAEERAYAEQLAPGISFEQLLRDLHSGRLAGRYGPFVMDLAALALALLALSGAWLFLVPRRRSDHR